jgi:hypothetical protein
VLRGVALTGTRVTVDVGVRVEMVSVSRGSFMVDGPIWICHVEPYKLNHLL